MARSGSRKKKPSSKRYLAEQRWLQNKKRRAEKLLRKLEKSAPGKHKLIGFQVVKADKEYDIQKLNVAPYEKVIRRKGKPPKKKKPKVDKYDYRNYRRSRYSNRERNRYRKAMGLQKPKTRPLGQ
jgi:hypothetical protein